jgi:ATP-dependent protease ClpP protease subunit
MNIRCNKRRRLNDHSYVSVIASPPQLDDDKDSDEIVEVIDNNIYFYSDVTTKTCFSLIKSLRKLDVQLQLTELKNNVTDTHINLHIHSYGGDLFGAFAVIDKILTMDTPVHSYINGIAASAATIISIVCKKRFMYRHSYMLIHELSSCFWGKFHEMEDEYENNKSFMLNIKNIYKEHTNLKGNKLEKILKRDIWWDAKVCLENGLIDKIIK